MPFLQARAHLELSPTLRLSSTLPQHQLGFGCSGEPLRPAWAALIKANYLLISNFSTNLAEPGGISGLGSGSHPRRQAGGRRRTGAARSAEGHVHCFAFPIRESLMSSSPVSSSPLFEVGCSPPCMWVCGGASCFDPLCFSPYFSPVSDCGQPR